jgi:hypothetical protein
LNSLPSISLLFMSREILIGLALKLMELFDRTTLALAVERSTRSERLTRFMNN